MSMEYNKSPLSMREGKVMIDGVVIADSIKCEIKFTPDVWSGKQLGEKTDSSRWLGGKITGTITRRRSTPFLKPIIAEYLKTGKTPEMTIQGIHDDSNSDFYLENGGSDVITAIGCVLTGDLNLVNLDSGGEVVEDAIGFNAKSIV
ncbi:phage tail tube protein [Intestinimonas butyriciproducens]|uniref:phage tail tube protein n=1 Tax=Intestinimonas butyriciproducens TaxID=1297617 RepID=UPI0018A08D43|nr:phage tail tube protein [Intestinimonas butyriciproducens]